MILRKLKDKHYVITNGKGNKNGDYCLHLTTFNISQHHSTDNNLNQEWEKIEYSTQPLEDTGLNHLVFNKIDFLDISEVEKAILGYSVEDMAETDRLNCGWTDTANLPYTSGYIRGFNAHKELVKDKLFTVKDMKLCYMQGWNRGREGNSTEMNNYIQSLLPKTEWVIKEITPEGKIKLL